MTTLTRTVTCEFCKDTFERPVRPGTQARFCSDKCRDRARYARVQERKDVARQCSRCRTVKPGSEFSSASAPYCRPCQAEYAKAQYHKNTAKLGPEYVRKLNLRRYGLTIETFAALLEAQGGVCAVCGRDEPGGQGVWHVDHDHSCCNTRKISCGRCIRGLLCTRCNIGIGNFGDSPEVIRAAADYLDAHAARRAAHTATPTS